jgi:hypothetical protein
MCINLLVIYANRICFRQAKQWGCREEVGSVTDITSIEDVDMSDGEWLVLARSGYQLNRCRSLL